MSTKTPGIILRAHPSRIPPTAAGILTGLFLLFVDWLTIPYFGKIPLLSTPWLLISAALMLGIIGRTALDLTECYTDTLTLTQTKIIWEHGLINRDYVETPIQAIQTKKLLYPGVGRLLNYATLVIGTPSGPIRIRHIPHPKKWIAYIEQLQQQPTRPAKTTPNPHIMAT